MKVLHKMGALLVLALFVLSVLPAGLADETEVDEDGDEVNDENDEDKEKAVKSKNEGKGKKISSKELKREIKLVQKEAKEKYEKAKERFEEAKEKQKEHQVKLQELNKAVKSCDAENCTALKSELRLGVKNHLDKTVQVVERSLEKLRNKIEGIEDLSAEEKEHALSLIAEMEVELDTLKLKIEGFTAETPKEEIRAAIQELKDLTLKVKQLQRRMVGLLVNAKLHTLVEKHLELHEAMQARIDFLAEQGADVSALEEILTKFDVKVEELQTDFEIAQEMWMNIDVAEDFDTFNRELRRAQHEVRKDLLETRESLRDFVAAYKKIAAGLKAENETEEPEDTPENETSELPVNESETPSAPVNESEGNVPANETAGNESTKTGEVNGSTEVNETDAGAEAELNLSVQV